MEKQKLKKIKDQLEAILKKTITDESVKGTDINSQVFQSKIDEIRKKIIRKMKIDPREYASVEEFLQLNIHCHEGYFNRKRR